MNPSLAIPLLLAMSTANALAADNPFFEDWGAPFAAPPFDQIVHAHYQPAFDLGVEQQQAEVDAITASQDAPSFANSVEALERSGELLTEVSSVFFSLKSSMNDPQMEAIAGQVVPALSKHRDEIRLNDALFRRVEAVYNQRTELDLTQEQQKLLEEQYKSFVRGGARLPAEEKDRLKTINSRLSVISLQFGENVLKENNRFEMVLERDALDGLPQGVVAAASDTAAERGHQGKWVFTLHKPSLIPFLQYSERRDLREKLYTAYITRGDHGDELDNKEIVKETIALRIERAKLLGYPTHTHYVLEENMAKEPAAVDRLLRQLWAPALQRAKAERAEMQAMIDAEGGGFQLAPWDWDYYAEKVKKAQYDLDEEMLRPYFKLENVLDGAFDVATRLYGLEFTPRPDLPVYHEEVTAFEVQEADGSHVGVLYVDYFPRASKRGGAWMGELRQQSKPNGQDVRPIIYNVGNFTEPIGDKPALLSFDEVETLFHEFGHGLHGLLSACAYESLSGTNVDRDFVELPSQIMENWASEPEVLKSYAKHYQTGQPMPDDLIAKIHAARHFNQGFATTEYLAAALLDMAWHTLAEVDPELDVPQFENSVLRELGLIPEITSRYRSTYFQHIFSGGYSSGYYSYVWAEVLDADAFQAFQETGDLFHSDTASSFRNHILSRGGTEEAKTLYQRFRGQEPSIAPLLKRRGLE